ncbi:MAG TPA: hypothetical protein VE783_08820 [Candidatus Limnocylindrales bacterium]|nr:hypothetical protein [Candidatus Limnocylindrales bacterium]
MESLQRTELEKRLRAALREHQHEGLHMVGGVDQLIPLLLAAVEEWLQEGTKVFKKTA